LQRQHLGHLAAMRAAGHIVAAGPFDSQPDESWRGLCIYREDLAEATRLARLDPSVRRGRLEVTALTWYTAKGALTAGK
jgi:uncharacterized protein